MVPPKLLALHSRGALASFAARAAAVASSPSSSREMCTQRQPSKVVIPNRIERGPTDILKALAATVGPDYTAAHYKYHDDPYLLPSSNVSKRVYAMSKESGRKAARYIRDKHSDYFLHREADPFVEAFAPKLAVPDDPSKLTVEDLERAIESGDVEDSCKIYEILTVSGTEVGAKVLQNMLEMLSYFNGQQAAVAEFLEERWYTVQSESREQRKKIWKDGGMAEEIFNALPEPRSPEAHAALIRGMAKYYQVEKSWVFFRDARKNGITLDTETYNAILRVVNFIREGSDQCWELVMELLTEMRQAGLKPNLGTMNAVLETISSLGAWRQRREQALSTLSEFSRLGVQPCLGTYYLLLNIFYKDRGTLTTVVYDIVEQLEAVGMGTEVRDEKDTNFFVTAMDIATTKFSDLNLGQRIHALLLADRNYDFIGDSYKESIYYRNYFTLLNQTLPVDEFMDCYDKLVPFAYTPEPTVMLSVLKSVDLNAAVRHLPRLWSDMIVFDHVNRQNLVEEVAGILPAHLSTVDDDLAEKLLVVGRDLFERVDNPTRERAFVSWTGEMLGNLLLLFGKRGDLVFCGKILASLKGSKYEIVGLPPLPSLKAYLDRILETESPARQALLPKAVELVCYVHDCSYPEARAMALTLGDHFEFDFQTREKINTAFRETLYPEPVQEILSEEELYRRRKLSASE